MTGLLVKEGGAQHLAGPLAGSGPLSKAPLARADGSPSLAVAKKNRTVGEKAAEWRKAGATPLLRLAPARVGRRIVEAIWLCDTG
jgi:hypothetical protein